MPKNWNARLSVKRLFGFILWGVILIIPAAALLPLVARNTGSISPVPILPIAPALDNAPHSMIVPILVFIMIFGFCIGSFANTLIYRIPRKIPFVYDLSACPACNRRIMPYDLLPIVSYIVLGGVCRQCQEGIPVKYPIIEWSAGWLAIVAVWAYGFSAAALASFGIFITLLCISAIDAEHMIIPDELIVALAVLSIAHATFCRDAAGIGMLDRVLGFFALSLPMLALTYLIQDAFGGGDIKLIAACGFLLGIKLILLAGFIAVLLGGFRGIYVKYVKSDTKTVHIAFGQYICIGTFTAMLFGDTIIQWYLVVLL